MRLFALCAALAGLLTAGVLSATSPVQSSVITGRLLGHDGKPMVKAHVHLTRPPGARTLLTVDVSPSGRFRLTTEETGALLLQFTGPHHRRKFVPLMIRKPLQIGLDVRLGTYEYVEDFSGVRVIGDFNGFSRSKATEMVKRPDGTYSLEVETSSPRVSYELVNIEKTGHAVNGTDSNVFEYDGGGDYRSILRVSGGRVTIRFDPRRLVRFGAPARARFADVDSVEARLLSIFDDGRAREDVYRNSVERSEQEGKSEESVHLDWSAAAAALSRRLEGERDPLLREALRLSLVDLAYCGGDLSPETLRTAIAGVPPGSPLWSYNPLLIGVVVRYAQPGAAAADSDLVEQIIAGRPEPEAKSLMLFVAVWKARELRQNERANRYYRRLVSDYPDSREAKAVTGLGSGSKIQAGKPVPSFSFPALDDPDTRYTPETLRGKVYLLDFWATWCSPCVGEMETIHKAYEKYKGQGFEVVSLSLDGRPDDVRKFRKGKWPMPWLHTFVADGFVSDTARTFEVGAIPKPILVDGNGVIFATWEDLSGPALGGTLDRVFGKKK